MTSARRRALPRIEALEDRCTPTAVTSTFTNGREAWTTIRNDFHGAGSTGLAWFANGGSPGGFIRATDIQDAHTWYWRAPNKFRGDHSDLANKWLTYGEYQTVLSAQFSAR